MCVYCQDLPSIGETLTGNSFVKNFGGKGANQAVTAVRLGVCVAMCGMVGKDTFGDSYREHLLSEGCNIEHILHTGDAATGVASITVDSKGQNTIVVVPGANLLLTESHIQNFRSVLEISRILLCQNEISLTSTIQALRIARECGCCTIFNPAPASSECVIALPYADIVCPNETELALLTGMPTSSDTDVIKAAAKLMERSDGGCRAVIVSLGERGACVVTLQSASFVPAPKVSAVDTVGAGDCFLGLLL